ncbi:MAG: hypothetical protein K0R66_575 [Gammaproteobacteria bacterium]|jgi:hypothetical protein|nr:hypothetical protein [Gammaproteobacteria bacterium]
MPRYGSDALDESFFTDMDESEQQAASREYSLFHGRFSQLPGLEGLDTLTDTRSCFARVFFCCSSVSFKQVLDEVQISKGFIKSIDMISLSELFKLYRAAQTDTRLDSDLAQNVSKTIVMEVMNCFEVNEIEAELYQGLKTKDEKEAALITWLNYAPEQRDRTKKKQLQKNLDMITAFPV